MTNRQSHPVWDVYDDLRTARLNASYYTVLLSQAQARNRNLEILIAIAVPSSAVAGIPLWDNAFLAVAWGIIVAIGAIVSVAKPFMRLADAVQSYEAAVARFRIVESDLEEIRREISLAQEYDAELQAKYKMVSRGLYRAREVEPREPYDTKLRDRLFNRIVEEFPRESFFVPENTI